MLEELTESVKDTIKSAAGKLTGFWRRQFQTEMAIKYCEGHPRRTEEVFGWGRDAVNTGLNELRIGIRYLDGFSARGRLKTEEQQPELASVIHAMVEPESQADPKFQTPAELNNSVVCNARRRASAGGRSPSLGRGTSLVC